MKKNQVFKTLLGLSAVVALTFSAVSCLEEDEEPEGSSSVEISTTAPVTTSYKPWHYIDEEDPAKKTTEGTTQQHTAPVDPDDTLGEQDPKDPYVVDPFT